jgi:hypothetical protein
VGVRCSSGSSTGKVKKYLVTNARQAWQVFLNPLIPVTVSSRKELETILTVLKPIVSMQRA